MLNDLFVFNCRYENSNGDVIYFDRPPYVYKTSTLFDNVWELTVNQRGAKDGGTVSARRRPASDKTITIDVFGENERDYCKIISKLQTAYDYDIVNKSPGRLYVNNQYCTGYLYGIKNTLDRNFQMLSTVTLTFMPEQPAWCEESSVLYSSSNTYDGGRIYPYRYPYKYTGATVSEYLMNDFYTTCPMIIEFFGPCEDPYITISGNRYGVTGTVGKDERLVINQLTHKIQLIDNEGKIISRFDSRDRKGDIFKECDRGLQTIAIGGKYDVKITQVRQRSVPTWT